MRPYAVVLLAAAGLTACGGPDRADAPGAAVDELSQHGGEVCPDELPKDPDDEFGFGTESSADEVPHPGDVDQVWACTYLLSDASGAWQRDGEAGRLDDDLVPDVEEAIDDLEPADDGDCTADLGPRHLVVTVRDGKDLTGYVVDNFGCRDVRITDDPFETVAGDGGQAGTVEGVLAGGNALLDLAFTVRQVP